MRTVVYCLVLLVFTPTMSQTAYTTSCEMKDGKAYGYVHNHKASFEIDGDVWFHFYDEHDRFIASEDEYEYEFVSARSTEEIEHTIAPRKACQCRFDVSTAVKVDNAFEPHTATTRSQAQATFTTSCEIRNGKAYGYVHNHQTGFEVNGTVWFYFFDSNGHFLASEDELEYEYVSARSVEEIEYTRAPLKASQCTFDVREAIKRANVSPEYANQLHKTQSGEVYTTSCEIKNGKAHGYVHNHGDSFEIDGAVWFRFYDVSDRFLESEDEFEYEFVSARSTEEIESMLAPRSSKRCYFDVRSALVNK